MKLSVIVPVYNEAATVAEVVRRVFAVALDGVEKEVVIVNDGSTDETGAVLDHLAARWPDVLKVVNHQQNQGKGMAIRTALEHVTGDVVITQDADLEYDPGEYSSLLIPFEAPAVQVVLFKDGRILPSNERGVKRRHIRLSRRALACLGRQLRDPPNKGKMNKVPYSRQHHSARIQGLVLMSG